MIYGSQLEKMTNNRAMLPKVFGIMLAPVPFLISGIVMLIMGFSNGPIYLSAIGLAVAGLGIWVGARLFRSAKTLKDQAYRLFHDNEVYVDPTAKKLRQIDSLAIEKFGGAIKPALLHIAQSSEYHRRERLASIGQWYDYERDYIQEKLGKAPLYAAKTSRTEKLTQEIIEEDLKRISRYYHPGSREFVLFKAKCVKKTFSPGIDGATDTYHLHFSDNGLCECDPTLYTITQIGEKFYVARVRGKTHLKAAYPVVEWTLDADLQELVQCEDIG